MRLSLNKWSLISLGILVTQTTWAQSSFQNNILWKDSKGLVSAAHCLPAIYDQIPFVIAEDDKGDGSAKITVRLKDENTIRVLPTRSILILNNTPELHHTRLIKVAGIAKNNLSKNSALRSDEGQIFETHLQNVDDYVIHIQNDTENKKIKSIFFKAADTLWQVAMRDEKYLGLSCNEGTQKKDYTLFNVFTMNSDQSIAQVAVASDNTEIFKSIKVFSADEIEALITKDDTEGEALTADEKTELSQSDSFTTAKDFVVSGYKTPQTSIVKIPTTTVKTQIGKDGRVTVFQFAKSIVNVATDPVGSAKRLAKNLAEHLTGRKNNSNSNDESIVDYIICTKDSGLSIRNEKAELLFTADHFERVQVIQSWTDNKDKTRIQVKFPNRKGQTGYAASEFVKLKSACQPYIEEQKQKDDAEENIDISKGGSLKSAECCVFPTQDRPTQSYKEGMRKFRAGRGKGKRTHAACDLYRKKHDPAVAVTTGKVVRNLYFFYQGTYALEVVHTGGQIVRYGELTGKRAENTSAGNSVKPGQTIGYIGKVNSGCCKPMLHFELYSGERKGSLTNFSNRPYQRRSDLMNPTEYLNRWEKKQFGVSY